MKKLAALALSAALAFLPMSAEAQLPAQVTTINPGDLFQDVVNGAPTPQNFYASAATMNGLFGVGTPSRGNALIGGDATTNLWQRATAGAATTSGTPTYSGPDRFAQWVLTSSSVTLSRDSASTDVFNGYQYSFKLAHTNTTGGQICMAQEVSSANSYQFAGQTAEFDFHAYLGAGYTGGTSLTAYIVTGTGTDDGMGKMAYTINAAGTSPGWAGGALATSAVIPLSTVSTGGRFAAIATIPTTATEIGVAICYTAGTTDTNDYVALAGLQLVRNNTNASFVNTGVGYNDATTTNFTAASFERRPQAVETELQYAYYYQLNDPAATVTIGPCQVITANVAAVCLVPLPAPMWKAPTITAPGSNTAFAITAANGAANICTALAVTGSATVLAAGSQISVTCTPTSNIAITVPSQLIGDAQAFSIKASAEL